MYPSEKASVAHYHYEAVRHQFKPGDLLVWSTDDTTWLSSIFTRVVRFLTLSDYSHTAIVWIEDNRVYAIDATIPKIKLTPLSECKDFYHIPMELHLTPSDLILLKEYIYTTYLGKAYGILDAIRGYLGYINESNDQWQCAELCHNFYKKNGIDLQDAYTPSKLIKAIFKLKSTTIRFIKHG